MQLNLGLLGYTTELSHKGLAQLARNNSEQVLKCDIKQGYLKLKDGTHVKALHTNLGMLDMQLRGWWLDQLILFDDSRWLICSDKCELIHEIRGYLDNRSRVPAEFQIIEYEDVR